MDNSTLLQHVLAAATKPEPKTIKITVETIKTLESTMLPNQEVDQKDV
ncbi:hypothetical protein ACWNT8_02580 [Pigmentibacter ruber]|nr:hypothetical protein [Pigmentibacter ruber]BFD30785.1 hypothetical protein GTC16762_04030 [Pigmentibacter ruber]